MFHIIPIFDGFWWYAEVWDRGGATKYTTGKAESMMVAERLAREWVDAQPACCGG